MGSTRVVLVHGAWGSPAIWDEVVGALDGVDVRVADLPTMQHASAGLADDVAHVRDLIGPGPTVLCGLSYGGVVITEAAAQASGVSHLVYVAAAVPDEGESMFDITMRRPIEGVPLEFREDGTSLPGAWGVDDGRYSARALARFAAIAPRPFAVSAAVTPVSSVSWRDIPSTYVVATRDAVLHPETQRELAARTTAVVELDSDHMVPFEHPEAVAATLLGLLAD